MSVSDAALEWMRYARNDLAVARHLYNNFNPQ